MREENLPQIPGYIVKEKLGEGGMATIYLAVQAHLEREVAIKVLKPFLLKDEQSLKRFKHEAQTASKLSHPNIITIFDVDHDGDTHYIVMEYLKESLRTRMKTRGTLPPGEALGIIKKLADALFTAHSQGVIHRDIKPDNVMFRPDGDPVLLDFGIARALDLDTRLTITGVSVGTPNYMSPEQCRGEELDGRSDIYSLGILFFELLTGKVPYAAEYALGIIYHHTHSPIPQLPQEFHQYQPLIDAMMAKDKETRIRDGVQLVERVALLEKGLSPVEKEIGKPAVQPLHPWRKEKNLWAWISLIVVIVGLLIYFFLGPTLKVKKSNPIDPPGHVINPEFFEKPEILSPGIVSEYEFNTELELAKKYVNEGKYDNALAALAKAREMKNSREIDDLERNIKDKIEEIKRNDGYRKNIDLAISYYRAGEYDRALEALTRAKTYKNGIEILELEKKIAEKKRDRGYQDNYAAALSAIDAGDLDRALEYIKAARSFKQTAETDQLEKEVRARIDAAKIKTVNFVDLSRETIAGLNNKIKRIEILNLSEGITVGGEIQLNLAIDENGRVSVNRLDDSRIIVRPVDQKETVNRMILEKIDEISVNPLEDETGKPLRVENWRKMFNLGTYGGKIICY